MLNTSLLPKSFALSCPECETGSLHDGHLLCPSCGFAVEHDGRIAVLEHAPVEEDYSEEGAGVQNEVKESHFWFCMRNLFILQILSDVARPDSSHRCVEYGCSNGLVMAELERAGWTVLGTDMHLSGLRNAAGVVNGPLVCAPLERVGFSEPVDLVCFFDVIEHLPDDLSALRKAVAQLKEGGHIVVTVPAFQSLWSTFDVLLGHKRRYTVADLSRLFDELGLETVRLRYAFSFSFPLVWIQRRLIRDVSASEQRRAYYRPPHPFINMILKVLCRFELRLASFGIDLPFGTSVMALARKPIHAT